jgi:hypothetical protein
VFGLLLPLPERRVAHYKGNEMGFITSLIAGGIVGWLASIIMKTNAQMGIIANVLVGIAG